MTFVIVKTYCRHIEANCLHPAHRTIRQEGIPSWSSAWFDLFRKTKKRSFVCKQIWPLNIFYEIIDQVLWDALREKYIYITTTGSYFGNSLHHYQQIKLKWTHKMSFKQRSYKIWFCARIGDVVLELDRISIPVVLQAFVSWQGWIDALVPNAGIQLKNNITDYIRPSSPVFTNQCSSKYFFFLR